MKNIILFFIFIGLFFLFGCISLPFFDSNPTHHSPPKADLKLVAENQTQNQQQEQTNKNENESLLTNSSIPTKINLVNESNETLIKDQLINLSNLNLTNSTQKINHNILEIYFFDVGFGDATLLRTKNSTILIGTGPAQSSLILVEKLNALNVKQIDELILDSWLDTKIGGLPLIIKNFQIGRILAPKTIPPSKQAQNAIDLIKKYNILVYNPKALDYLTFGGLSLEVLNPQEPEYPSNIEANSIVLLVQYGNFCLFLPSDINQENEPPIISLLKINECSIFKWRKNGEASVGPSILFNRLKPKEVIISTAKTSKGEYPSPTTLTYISIANAGLHRTDIDKDIFINASFDGSYLISHNADLKKLGEWFKKTDAYK
jgi:competence protein ComEC